MLITLISVNASVYSQITRLDLKVQSATIKDVLTRIEDQSNFFFMYNDRKIDVERKVDLDVKQANIEAILKTVFDGTNTKFIIKDRQIVLYNESDEEFRVPNALSGSQQGKSIIGKVTDTSGIALPGVSVVVKGTTTGTITDNDGRYSIANVPPNATLQFSFVGMKSEEIIVAGKATINVTLAEESIGIEEVVAVGYGQQKKSDLSSSISTVNVNQLKTIAVLPNLASALEGTTPGLSVTSSTGAPGAGVNIKIRGISTFLNSKPLVIIDGAPGDLNDVNPNDVESVQVLKDAASAAIYGSRSANGVIIVTTKKGKAGKIDVEISSSYSMQYPGKKIPVANAEQYALINNTIHASVGKAGFDNLKDPASLGVGTNWQDVFYNSAPIFNTYVGISGGTENSTFRISGSFDDQNGIAIDSEYKKGIISFAGRQKKGAFTFGENIGYTKFRKNNITEWLVQGLLVAQPIIPLYDPANDCGYGGVPSYYPNQGYNAYGLSKMVENIDNNGNINIEAFAQAEFLHGFTYKLNVGYKNWFGYGYNYTPVYHMSTNVFNEYATLDETRSESTHWLVENTLMYNKKMGKHAINALVGYTFEQDQSRNLRGVVKGFPNNDLRVIDASTGYSNSASGNASQWDMISMLGRVIYNYDDRYYLTANVRRDGSSRFSRVNRYGTFPSFSAAWRASGESFFKPLLSVVDDLKLRGSYGFLGNQPGGNYDYIPTGGYSTGLGYLFGTGTSYINGATISGYTDPNIQWERTKSANFGLDINLLKCLSVSADYFSNFTDKLLLGVPIAPSIGGGSPTVNTGQMENKGFEFSMTYNSSTSKEFQYKVTANISTVSNKVIKLGRVDETIYGSKLTNPSTSVTAARVNYPIGSFFLKQDLGIFQTQEEINNWKSPDGKVIQPLANPGDVKYLDANNDGVINSSDAIYSGNPLPDFAYGLNFSANYKNFDCTIFLQGTYGNKMFDANSHRLHQGTTDYNMSPDLLDAWASDNTDTKQPRLIFSDPNLNSDASTRFLFDASFLRVKTIQLGYSFSQTILGKTGLSGLRVYVSANNILTFTKYPGYDPSHTSDGLLDAGLDNSIYPIAKIVSAGLSVRF